MQLRTLLSLGLVAFATAQYSSTSKTSSVSALSSTTASSQSRVSASAAAGQTLRVNVSNANAGLFYSPNVITAAKGAKVEFHYNPKNHSVVQSSFGAPCQPLAGGVNSGFVPSAAGESPTVFTVTVNDTTTPIWLYCAQTAGNHCQNGMSMVINQQPGPNTLQAYQAASKNTTTKAGSSISVCSRPSLSARDDSLLTWFPGWCLLYQLEHYQVFQHEQRPLLGLEHTDSAKPRSVEPWLSREPNDTRQSKVHGWRDGGGYRLSPCFRCDCWHDGVLVVKSVDQYCNENVECSIFLLRAWLSLVHVLISPSDPCSRSF